MKRTLLITLSLMFVLQSCAEKSTSSESTSSMKNKIVLGAFNDMVTSSSYNDSALFDIPDSVNFSNEMTAVKNQGQRGTCTFFAATALVEAALKMDKGVDVNLSEEFMIYSTKNQGYYSDVEASHVSVNLQAVKEGGILLEKDWGYIPSMFEEGRKCQGLDGESNNTPIDCYVHTPSREIQKKIIPGNAIKTGFIRKNTNEIMKFLAKNKRPLTISLPVNYRGWKDWGEVSYTEDMRQECLSDPTKCGAHSVVLTGYNRTEKVFYFKNSWGNDWGEAGFGKLSFEMVDRYVDGYLYYARVDGEIDFPLETENSKFELEKLEVIPALTSESLRIQVEAKAAPGNGQYFEIQHYLAVEHIDEDYEGATPQYEALLGPQGEAIIFQNDSLTPTALLGLSDEFFFSPRLNANLTNPELTLTIVAVVTLYSDTSTNPTMISHTNFVIKR